jgi:hypothetical protein
VPSFLSTWSQADVKLLQALIQPIIDRLQEISEKLETVSEKVEPKNDEELGR